MVLRKFECGICLSITKSNDYPEHCDYCEMGWCSTCGTILKVRNNKNPKMCRGCATLFPEVYVIFTDIHNFSCVYMEEDWNIRNLPKGQKYYYRIWSSATKSNNMTLVKHYLNGERENVRVLTEEEVKMINEST